MIKKELKDFEKNLTELEKTCFVFEAKSMRKRAKTDVSKTRKKANRDSKVSRTKGGKKKLNPISEEIKKKNMFLSLLKPEERRPTTLASSNAKKFKFSSKGKGKGRNKSVEKKKSKKEAGREKSRIKETIKRTIMYPFNKLFKKG